MLNCVVNAEAGVPLVYEKYWLVQPRVLSIIAAHEHTDYMFEYASGIYPRLEKAIRNMDVYPHS